MSLKTRLRNSDPHTSSSGPPVEALASAAVASARKQAGELRVKKMPPDAEQAERQKLAERVTSELAERLGQYRTEVENRRKRLIERRDRKRPGESMAPADVIERVVREAACWLWFASKADAAKTAAFERLLANEGDIETVTALLNAPRGLVRDFLPVDIWSRAESFVFKVEQPDLAHQLEVENSYLRRIENNLAEGIHQIALACGADERPLKRLSARGT